MARRRPGPGQNQVVHIPAKVDYGLRALLTLAAAGAPQTADQLAADQGLPPRFLGAILADLRRSGLVASQRGAEGGLPPGPGAREDHPGRGHQGPRRPAGRGARLPARGDQLRRRGRAPAAGLGGGAGQPPPGPRERDGGRGGFRSIAQAAGSPHRRPGRLGAPLAPGPMTPAPPRPAATTAAAPRRLRPTLRHSRAGHYRRPGGPWALGSLDALLSAPAARRGHRVVDGRRRSGGAELAGSIDDLAGRLRRAGVRRGDAVAWQLPNGLAAMLLFRACWRLGAVATPIHPSAGPAELASALEQTVPPAGAGRAGIAGRRASGARSGSVKPATSRRRCPPVPGCLRAPRRPGRPTWPWWCSPPGRPGGPRRCCTPNAAWPGRRRP